MGQQPSKAERDSWISNGSEALVVEEALAGFRYDARWTPSPSPPPSTRRLHTQRVGKTLEARVKTPPETPSKQRIRVQRPGPKQVRTAPKPTRTPSFLPPIKTTSPILNPYSPEPAEAPIMPTLSMPMQERPPSLPAKPMGNSLGRSLCFEVEATVPFPQTPSTDPPFARSSFQPSPHVQLPFHRVAGRRVASCPAGPSPSPVGRSSTPVDEEERLLETVDLLAGSLRVTSLASPRPPLPTFTPRPSYDMGASIVRAKTPTEPPRLPLPRSPSPLMFDIEPEQHEKHTSSRSSPSRRRPLPTTPMLGEGDKSPVVVDALTSFKSWSNTTQMMSAEATPTSSVFLADTPEATFRGGKREERFRKAKAMKGSKSAPMLGERSTRSKTNTQPSSSTVKIPRGRRRAPAMVVRNTTTSGEASSATSSAILPRNANGIRLVSATRPRKRKDALVTKRTASRTGRTKKRPTTATRSETPEIRVSFTAVADPMTGRLGEAAKRGFDGKEISNWLEGNRKLV